MILAITACGVFLNRGLPSIPPAVGVLYVLPEPLLIGYESSVTLSAVPEPLILEYNSGV